MASLSAARSPSQQQTNTFLVPSSHGPIPSQLFHPHHHQSSSTSSGVDQEHSSSGVLTVCPLRHSSSRTKLFYESDFSSPTSWEFRDSGNICHFAPPSSLPITQMPASAFPSSSASPASTPSPLDEAPYQVQMHLSLLRNSSSGGTNLDGNSHHSTPNHPLLRHHNRHSMLLSPACHAAGPPPPPLSSSTVQPQNVSNGGGGSCACVSANCNGTMVMMNGEPDLSGNGSDGSRNSTGSHRSQDSGFSDSGETRRSSARKCSAVGGNETFNHSSLHQLGNGNVMHHGNSNGNCNGTITFDNGNGYHHINEYEVVQQAHHHRQDPNGNGSCCERPVSPPPNGYQYAHIYDCIPMPSPIPPAGFGCGRLVTQPSSAKVDCRTTPTPINGNGSCVANGHHEVYTTFPLSRRQASVDIQEIDGNGNRGGGGGGCSLSVPIRMSPSPPTTTCTNCLSSSQGQDGHDHYKSNQRRSFSPQRASSPHHNHHHHHHDISLLASSSTATAVAALRVPLSSSTPKRFSKSGPSSTSRLGNGNMVKIDNFESLNKNVNKDNNNNSSNGNSANSTPGKSGNKTFTVVHSKEARSGSQTKHVVPLNGTVLAEDAAPEQEPGTTMSRRESAVSVTKANGGPPAGVLTLSRKGNSKTAAESIYDKICSRLSSLSSSSSTSSTSSPSTSSSSSTQPTQILQHQSSSSNSNSSTQTCNGFASHSTTTMENETVILYQKASPPPRVVDESFKERRSEPNNDEGMMTTTAVTREIGISPSSEKIIICEKSDFGNATSHKVADQGGASSKPKLRRTSSTKWGSLPRGVSSKRLSLLVEKGDILNDTPGEIGVGIEYPVDVGIPLPVKESIPPTVPEEDDSLQDLKEVKSKTGFGLWSAAERHADSEVVRLWLQDLRTQTEPECLHSLQTKWIVPAEYQRDEDDDEETIRSISPTTTVTSTITTGTSGGCMSSSSCHPQSDDVVTSSSELLSTIGYHKSKDSNKTFPSSPSSSAYVNKQLQRRSQQKFLSSMTAAIHAVSTPLMSIRNVEMTANIISGEFSKICKHLEFGIFTQVPTLVLSLVGHIEDFLRAFHNAIGFGNLKKLENRLENACYALHMAAKSMSDAALMISSSIDSGHNSNASSSSRTGSSSSSSTNYHHPRTPSTSSSSASSPDCLPSTSSSSGASGVGPFSQSSSDEQGPESLGREYHVVVGEVVEGIVTVGNLFSQVVDLRLTRDLACILDTIEGGGIPARIALKSLVTVLADGGNHICRLAADIRTVRGLLGVLLDTREDQDKILALRCLATVLCVGEAVKDFDKAGGFEIIADLIYEPSYSTWMKIEAVAVLTQATDPWIDLETTLMTLGVHLEKFIVALTNLTREFKTDEEPFLLIVAAISNLTFLEVASTEYLKRCRTVSYLIDAVKGNPSFSVFILDHIATILANMAGVETCRQEIIQCGGIDALLQFLQQRPSGRTESVSEITACERLQQKSTIALSRLCNENGVARYVFDMGGIHRLVTLCRKEKERNYSDGVLIAALATLRKLVTSCGKDALNGLGAEDLIEPRLLDSFLLYSSRQESYV